MKNTVFLLFVTLFLLSNDALFAQKKTTVTGKVTDASSADPMPFVNVFFQGTQIGTTTDFNGKFTISTDQATDTLIASYLETEVKMFVNIGQEQVINFAMTQSRLLSGVTVSSKRKDDNPAWEIMRSIVDNKSKNDLRSLDAYQYESYTKIEIDVNQITDKMRNNKAVAKVLQAVDSMALVVGDNAATILPVYLSESISQVYKQNNPLKSREDVLHTKISGIALNDGSFISQLSGSSFYEYNFYKNFISITEKEFISPISDTWRLFYDYDLLEEGVQVGKHACFLIAFQPKQPQDLAFTGKMWVDQASFGIKQIELTIGKEANLNFIERIKVQQEFFQTAKGAWVPEKTRLLIDVGEVSKKWAGLLLKQYISNRNIEVKEGFETGFLDKPLVLAENVMNNDNKLWQSLRHDTLSQTELLSYQMIDTVNNLPVVRTYIDIIRILVSGYKDVGKFGIGPYLNLYAYNNIEGNRFRIGFKSNQSFSKNLSFVSYLAYGTRDQQFKYAFDLKTMLWRKRWLTAGISYKKDIDQVGIFNDNLEHNSLFAAFTLFGTLRQPYLHKVASVHFKGDIYKNIEQKVMLRTRNFQPIFPFAYNSFDNTSILKDSVFSSTELVFETRFAFRQKFLYDGMSRTNFADNKLPIITFKYILGLQGFLDGDFVYQKYLLSWRHKIRLGVLGAIHYVALGGYTPSTIPYPLLEAHLGNQTFFYNQNSYNLMNFFEFVSDRYVSLKAEYKMDGLLLNRVPLMKKLKWRSFVNTSLLWGQLSQNNLDLIPAVDFQGRQLQSFNTFGQLPYAEVGVGVENIFKVFRVEGIYRLTYRDLPDARSFGLFISTQFDL